MQPQITKVDDAFIKVSVPQPNNDTFYNIKELTRHRDQAQSQVDYYDDLIAQAKKLGVVEAVVADAEQADNVLP